MNQKKPLRTATAEEGLLLYAKNLPTEKCLATALICTPQVYISTPVLMLRKIIPTKAWPDML